jgi:hypothetical protein
MVKRQGQRKRKGMSASKPRKVSVSHLLEVGTLESIKNAKQVTSEHLKYQWMNYAELAGQRSLIKEAIGQALTQTCISYSVKNWQRAVKYKYGLHPFSTTSDELLNTLHQPDWRKIPSNCDVPSNSQIFGHLIYSAGIEGILYPSKFTEKLCLAVFPRNFVATDSFVALDDEVPHPKVPARIDASSWRLCEMGAKEIIG